MTSTMTKIRNLTLLFILSFASTAALAGGSIGFDEADTYLKQAPLVRAYLLDTLCISDSGMATRVGGNYPLGGQRIGPYELRAKPRGIIGPYTMNIIINTQQRFFDHNGKEVQQNAIDTAYRIEESFQSVEIRVAETKTGYRKPVNCPE